ncbi:MAG: type II/IV secretion system ATPase subunit [Thaumarchaeota archaeon]|nr:type II/IV secretion system ATPase subunit [Nitrososphaerota archaeon]
MKLNFFNNKKIVKKSLKSKSDKKIPETTVVNESAFTNQKLSEFGVTSKLKESVDTSVDFEDFIDITKTGLEDYGIYTGIKRDPTAKGGKRYMVIEPTLTKKDKENFEKLRQMLMVELTVNLNEIKTKKDAEERLKKKLTSMIKKYDMDIPANRLPKIYYHAIRNFTRFGKIDPLMHDKMIEEISCDGVGIPLYIWHREYESMPTNVIFDTDLELENFVRKLAYVSGKHVSIANPIVDATLPDGSRVNLTLGKEVTTRGSTFTIRHYKEDPITIVDLIKYHTISSDIGAYLWFLVEKRLTMLIAGGTASGKTTTLNAMGTFIPPGDKVVSIEDTPELNLPIENWIPAISRQTFTDGGIGEITQYDLLRGALRQRPDIIIVGETRGREAHTLFQAMATGHGGFSSMHADTVSACINRLLSKPMDVPKVLLATTLDVIFLQLKLLIKNRTVRRCVQITEIAGLDENTGDFLLNDVFKWDPETDTYNFSGKSVLFDKIHNKFGISHDQIKLELSKRKTALEWMVENNIHEHKEVNDTIQEFYLDPERFYERKRMSGD